MNTTEHPHGITKISSWMYLSGAQTIDTLKKYSFTHTLNLASIDNIRYSDPDITTLNIDLFDHPNYAPTKDSLEAMNRFITTVMDMYYANEKIISSTGQMKTPKLLIHCAAGVSRSPTIVLYYYMRNLNLPLNKAWTILKTARPVVNPNEGLIRFLQVYEYNRKNTFPNNIF